MPRSNSTNWIEEDQSNLWEIPTFSEILYSDLAGTGDTDEFVVGEHIADNREQGDPLRLLTPHELCEHHGWELLLTDLSLLDLPVTAIAQRHEQFQARSHVLVEYDDEDGSVSDAYWAALSHLAKSKGAGNDPLVLHPRLFKINYCGTEAPPKYASAAKLDPEWPTERFARWTKKAWTVKIGRGNEQSLRSQVQLLFRRFLSGLPKEYSAFYRNAYLLIVPIRRPSNPIQAVSGTPGTEGDIKTGGAAFVMVRRQMEGEMWKPDIQRDQSDLRELCFDMGETLSKTSAKEAVGEHQLLQTRTTGIETLGHTMKTAVKATGWNTHGRELFKIAQGLPDEQRIALRRVEVSLSLFSMAEGLAGLANFNGILRNRERSKIQQWLDPRSYDAKRNALIVSDETRANFENTIFNLTKMLCVGADGFGVRFNGEISGAKEWKLEQVAHEPIIERIAESGIPPFRGGTDGAVALMSLFIEPIFNAYKAMQQDGGIESRDYIVSVETKVDSDGTLKARVSNPVTTNNPELANQRVPVGVTRTSQLLFDQRIIDFSRPKDEATGQMQIDVHLSTAPIMQIIQKENFNA